MITILECDKKINLFLGSQKVNTNAKYRLLSACVIMNIEGDTVIYNNFTKQMVVFEANEEKNFLSKNVSYNENIKKLIEQWFLVPIENDDVKLYNQFRETIKMFFRFEGIKKYTIFPTMDCNARCFYCFEHGAKKYHMSNQTALDVAEYIKKTHAEKTIKILWFGGEPLFNSKAIDIICEQLKRKNIDFESSMITNGYLLSIDNIYKAKEKWNLKKVQITLDGTEEVYNKCKSYIYKDDPSPFKTVMNNIKSLIDNNINTDIRLNLSDHNEKDLYVLVDDIYDKIGESKFLYVYTWLLYDNRGAIKHIKGQEEKAYLTKRLIELEEYIYKKGLKPNIGPHKEIKVESCSADSICAVTVLPNGNLGKCDHHSDDELFGSIYSNIIDEDMINSWHEKCEDIDLCKTCSVYPTCIKLKKCPEQKLSCDIFEQEFKISSLKQCILNVYLKYKKTDK